MGGSRPVSVWVVGGVLVVSLGWVAVRHVTASDESAVERVPVAVRPVTAAAPAASTVGPEGVAAVDGDGDIAGQTVGVAGPFGDEWGVPVGYLQTREGAQAAAVGWVGALGSLMSMGPIAVQDTLRALLSEAAAGPSIETFRQERQRFIDSFGADPSRGIWIESPLLVELTGFDPTRAVVKVWSQLLMGAASDAVTVLWRTQTVTLVWEREDWRVDTVVRVEGPTPSMSEVLLPSPGTDFAVLAGWTPAVLAGSVVSEEGR